MDGEEEIEAYEDEALEVISLSDGEGPRVEEVEGDLNDMELVEVEEDSGNEEDDQLEEAGGVVTFQPLRDDSFACFRGHQGPVFVIDVNITSSLVVTGGQDDKAFVWKLSNQEVLFECVGHQDSVTCVKFSHDDKYVASSDLGGAVKVRLCSNGKCVWNFETSPIEWLLWHNHTHILFAGTSDGEAWLWNIRSGEYKTLPSHGCGNMAAVLLPDGKTLCCGYYDGSLKVWDLKTTTLISSYMPSPNQMSPVTCLKSLYTDSALLLTGHEDGTAKLFALTGTKLLATLSINQEDNASGTREGATPNTKRNCCVEAVGFVASHNVVLVGLLSGQLSVWDLPTKKLRHICQPPKKEAGLVRMCISQLDPLVYTCHLDGVIRQWDILRGHCLKEWHGHSANILDMILTRDESILLTSSDDRTVRLYHTTSLQHAPPP